MEALSDPGASLDRQHNLSDVLSAFQLFPTIPFRILYLGGSKAEAGLFLGLYTYAAALSAPTSLNRNGIEYRSYRPRSTSPHPFLWFL